MKSANRVIRALIARLFCLAHIGLSIFVLYTVKRDFLYLIPIIGAISLVAETAIIIAIFKGREPTRWFSTCFFIYVTTIVVCYWFLELENIMKIISGLMIRDYKISLQDLRGDIISTIKVVWSQIELQIFFALIILIRWLIPKSNLSYHGLSDLLFKYFAISCDMLDFLSILRDTTLVRNAHLVYWTLSAWSLSTVQFFIFVPHYEDEEKSVFTAHISNSLLSALLMDLPYFGVRIAAIFGFGSHNYNSYFFTTKNVVMLLLQLFRIKASFSEKKVVEDKHARKLKDKLGFDKEANKLFDPNEVARRNFLIEQMRRNRMQSSDNSLNVVLNDETANPTSVINSESSNYNINHNNNNYHGSRKDNFDNLDDQSQSPTRVPRLPRSIEAVKLNRQQNQQNQQRNLDKREYENDDRYQQQQHYIDKYQQSHNNNNNNRPNRSRDASDEKLNYIKNKLNRPTEYMPEEIMNKNSAKDKVRTGLYSNQPQQQYSANNRNYI
jgi:hypothetical protein